MVLDERSRHQLYRKLQAVLGSDEATTLMELLPPVGWADVATKRDLDLGLERLELRLRERFANQTRTLVLAVTGINLALAFGIAGLT